MLSWEAHPLKGGRVGNRRDNQITATLERYKPFVEEMVNGGREQQPIFATQPLVVRAVAPGLDMTGDQMLASLDLRHATGSLDRRDIGPE